MSAWRRPQTAILLAGHNCRRLCNIPAGDTGSAGAASPAGGATRRAAEAAPTEKWQKLANVAVAVAVAQIDIALHDDEATTMTTPALPPSSADVSAILGQRWPQSEPQVGALCVWGARLAAWGRHWPLGRHQRRFAGLAGPVSLSGAPNPLGWRRWRRRCRGGRRSGSI